MPEVTAPEWRQVGEGRKREAVEPFTFSRRQIMAAIGGSAVFAAGFGANATSLAAISRPILIVDGMLSADELIAVRHGLGHQEPIVLGQDLVWDWRRGLQEKVAKSGALALTRWDKFVVLAGLAREARLAVRDHRIGHSAFLLEIG